MQYAYIRYLKQKAKEIEYVIREDLNRHIVTTLTDNFEKYFLKTREFNKEQL